VEEYVGSGDGSKWIATSPRRRTSLFYHIDVSFEPSNVKLTITKPLAFHKSKYCTTKPVYRVLGKIKIYIGLNA